MADKRKGNIFSQASWKASEASKTSSETGNLKRKIAYEKERIDELYMEIGKKFYENQTGDHESEVALCADIDDRRRRIASMQGDLLELKGMRSCPNCGAKYDEKYTFPFCGRCGSPLSVMDESESSV